MWAPDSLTAALFFIFTALSFLALTTKSRPWKLAAWADALALVCIILFAFRIYVRTGWDGLETFSYVVSAALLAWAAVRYAGNTLREEETDGEDAMRS